VSGGDASGSSSLFQEFGMTNKEAVIEAVRKLPDNASLDQISEEIAILAAIRRGEEAADGGRVISHEEVKRKFAAWTAK
jgi:predicted transcriptional regulator